MPGFRNILCIVDEPQRSAAAIARAADLAARSGARLTVAAVQRRPARGIVLPAWLPDREALDVAAERDSERLVDAALERVPEHVPVTRRVVQGPPFLGIIREVLAQGHDLVLKAPEDPEWIDRLFGSDDMHLLRKCPCPVWFERPPADDRDRPVVAAVDVTIDETESPGDRIVRDELNRRIADEAIECALSTAQPLHFVFAWEAIADELLQNAFSRAPDDLVAQFMQDESYKQEEILSDFVASVTRGLAATERARLKARTEVAHGMAQEAIAAVVRRLDPALLVMGTVARVGIPGWFIGNTAEAVLEQVKCSVLAVKPEAFVSPIDRQERAG